MMFVEPRAGGNSSGNLGLDCHIGAARIRLASLCASPRTEMGTIS